MLRNLISKATEVWKGELSSQLIPLWGMPISLTGEARCSTQSWHPDVPSGIVHRAGESPQEHPTLGYRNLQITCHLLRVSPCCLLWKCSETTNKKKTYHSELPYAQPAKSQQLFTFFPFKVPYRYNNARNGLHNNIPRYFSMHLPK